MQTNVCFPQIGTNRSNFKQDLRKVWGSNGLSRPHQPVRQAIDLQHETSVGMEPGAWGLAAQLTAGATALNGSHLRPGGVALENERAWDPLHKSPTHFPKIQLTPEDCVAMLVVRNGPSFIAELEWLPHHSGSQSGEGTVLDLRGPLSILPTQVNHVPKKSGSFAPRPSSPPVVVQNTSLSSARESRGAMQRVGGMHPPRAYRVTIKTLADI